MFGLVWLHWAASWIFRRIRTSSYNFCKKGYIWLNIWAKGGKKWPKICQWITYASTNNAVTSEVYIIFSWKKKKKQWQADKIAFLMINTFIYFTENVFPKYALTFQIFQKFGNFLHFLGLFQFSFLVKTYMDYSQTLPDVTS